MLQNGQKMDSREVYISSGVVLVLTLIMAAARLYIKISKLHRMYTDDYLFITSIVFLIAGTPCVFLVLPYVQVGIDTGAGIGTRPDDLTHDLDIATKLQDAFNLMANACIFSVKFAFLFFFRLLLEQTGKLQKYWWAVFIFTVPCALVCMCTNFMVCPAFGARIFEVCLEESALPRQFAALYTVVALDILTDLLLISIPICLLWNVKASIRRKLGLGSILCLSIFAIIINIIRTVGHKLDNGQNDVVWILFWLQMEACVAIIANSMTAFRSLFHASGIRYDSPGNQDGHKSPAIQLKKWTGPGPDTLGLGSLILKDPFEDREIKSSESKRTLTVTGGASWDKSSLEGGSQSPSKYTHRNWHETKGCLRDPQLKTQQSTGPDKP